MADPYNLKLDWPIFMATVEVEFLEAEVAEGVEAVVNAEFFVGEAVVVVYQGAEGFDCLAAAGVDL